MNQDVVILPVNKIRELFREELAAELKIQIPAIMRQANRKEYITTKEFKELTGCSHRVQQYLRNENKIPYSQEGRKIIYKTTDVEKFMDERRIEAREDIK